MDTTTQSTRLSHKRYLPWELKREDSYDDIAAALRGLSTIEQGGTPTQSHRSKARTLAKHLAEHNRVVKYDSVRGFRFVPRDPEIDDPDLPIRRPPVV